MGQEPIKVGRRSFINYLVAVVATGVIVGAGMYFAGPKQTVTKTVTSAVTSEKTVTITGTPTTTPTTTPYPMPPEPKEPIKLTVWLWGTFAPAIDSLNKIAYLWNKEFPKVQIEFTPIAGLSSLEFTQKAEQATVAGQGPDIIHNEDYAQATLIHDGFGEVLPSELQDLAKKAIHPKYLDACYFWGPDVVRRMYVLPGAYGTNPAKHTWINEYHVQEAGLSPDWNPADWDELVEVAQKMTKYDPAGKLVRSGYFCRVGGHVAGIFDKYSAIHRTAGGNIIWAEGGQWKTDIDSDITKNVIQRLYLDIMYKYKIYDPGFPGDVDAFAKELVSILNPRELREVVMSIKTLNPDRFWGPEGPKGFHGGPHPPPQKGMPSRTYIDGHTWTVNSKISEERKKWAFYFFAWYITDETVKSLLFNSIGNLTIFKDVMESPPFTNPWYQKFLKVCEAQDPISRVFHPRMAQIGNAGGTVLSRIYMREVDLETGIRQLGTVVREEMNKAPAPKS